MSDIESGNIIFQHLNILFINVVILSEIILLSFLKYVELEGQILGEELYKYLCFRSYPIICINSLFVCCILKYEINMFKPEGQICY